MKVTPKYLGAVDYHTGCKDTEVYEILTQLADDGTPNSDRFLRVRVLVHDNVASEVVLDLLEEYKPLPSRETPIGRFSCNNQQLLANLLYPTARLETVTTLVPS